VSDVLVNKANNFVSVTNPVVDKVNGATVVSVKMLHEFLRDLKDETLRIDFLYHDDPWILNVKEARAAEEATNRRYGVNPAFWTESYKVDAAITKGSLK
jgi:hypothetical protein